MGADYGIKYLHSEQHCTHANRPAASRNWLRSMAPSEKIVKEMQLIWKQSKRKPPTGRKDRKFERIECKWARELGRRWR